MSGLSVIGCIAAFGLVGWIPIYFFFNGMTNVILAKNLAKKNEKENNIDDNKENIEN